MFKQCELSTWHLRKGFLTLLTNSVEMFTCPGENAGWFHYTRGDVMLGGRHCQQVSDWSCGERFRATRKVRRKASPLQRTPESPVF